MMKNGTRKKINNTAKPESSDLRVEIEKRAHEIWLDEGGGHGHDLDHWLRAERELNGRTSTPNKMSLLNKAEVNRVMAATALLGFAGCRQKPPATPPPPLVEVAPVTQAD